MKTIIHTDSEQIEKFIRTCDMCFVGMADADGTPYVVPMNFGYDNGIIYLHSGPEGRKLKILEHNPKVCITFCTGHKLVWQHPDVACSYSMSSRSLMVWGTVEFEEEFDRKIELLKIFMRQYSDRDFKFSAPAVNNVRVWKVAIDSASLKVKEFGVSRKNYLPPEE